jgi:hypothetical protein
LLKIAYILWPWFEKNLLQKISQRKAVVSGGKVSGLKK